jgi:hypothetical protein
MAASQKWMTIFGLINILLSPQQRELKSQGTQVVFLPPILKVPSSDMDLAERRFI